MIEDDGQPAWHRRGRNVRSNTSAPPIRWRRWSQLARFGTVVPPDHRHLCRAPASSLLPCPEKTPSKLAPNRASSPPISQLRARILLLLLRDSHCIPLLLSTAFNNLPIRIISIPSSSFVLPIHTHEAIPPSTVKMKSASMIAVGAFALSAAAQQALAPCGVSSPSSRSPVADARACAMNPHS